MKRPSPVSRSGSTTQDVKRDLSGPQLQGIGAVAVAWNEVEFRLDCILYSGLNLSSSSWLDIVTRIGLDAKIDLIAAAEETQGLSDSIRTAIKPSIEALKELKELRNSVVHARVFDSTSGTGENVRRGGRISQILLTEEALDGLYKRLVMLRTELSQITGIFDLIRTSGFAVRNIRGADAASAIPEVQRTMELLQSLQSERIKLPPLPTFKN